ncbi:predicted protein [Chaetoceros tenuissimus]|uniref:Uncharacterized protein n=1 Tax=Chaetoceros tenuissimus TaxID=426638 RepID=A0AAD3CT09_9STRA|nr:predicted protein [Chaetoceros tenuissimus]
MCQQKAVENYSSGARSINENLAAEEGMVQNFWLLNLLLNFNYAENQAQVEIESDEMNKAEILIGAKSSAFSNGVSDEKRIYSHPTSLLDLDISFSRSGRDILSSEGR